jgi:hypothetical protein
MRELRGSYERGGDGKLTGSTSKPSTSRSESPTAQSICPDASCGSAGEPGISNSFNRQGKCAKKERDARHLLPVATCARALFRHLLIHSVAVLRCAAVLGRVISLGADAAKRKLRGPIWETKRLGVKAGMGHHYATAGVVSAHALKAPSR